MSKHTWVKENIASYLAGGLDDTERERLEQHTSGCPECARALAEAREVDRRLEMMFATERPQAMLEDWLIESVRTSTLPRPWGGLSRTGKVLLAAAAVLLLAFLGGGLSILLEEEQLRLPGADSITHTPREVDVKDGIVMLMMDVSGSMSDKDKGNVKALGDLVDEVRKDSEGRLGGKGQLHIYSEMTNGTTQHGHNLPVSQDHTRLPPATTFYGRTGASSNVTLRSYDWFSPDGKALASSGDGEKGRTTVQLWNADTGKHLLSFGFFMPDDVLSVKLKSVAQKEETKVAQKTGQKESEKKPAEGGQGQPGVDKKPEPAQDTGRKIIRTGEVEFEVDSFDAAAATIGRLVGAIKGGFVTTTNSDKLPNGKMRGSVVVRVPPQSLDGLLLSLRKELGKTGELKSQRIGSQDVTKQYTDLESRLKADRTLEERFLKIIRDGKGEIKDLLLAEKELGVVRTRIETLEGERRYLANLVALSTLTITLTEKEIRAAAQVCESERVQAGIEVEDVDKARQEALKEIAAVKGRVTRSELKQHAAGQFSAVLQFEVAPDAAGALRDRLRQLGNMVRLEIDRVQQAGSATVPPETPVKRGDTAFVVSLYNLANVAPRETVTLQIAVADVPAAYKALREAVGKVKGRVLTAQLNENDRQNVTAQLDFDVRRAGESGVLTALADAGEVLSRQVSRVAENENVTDAKVLFKVEVVSANAVPARETVTLGIEVADVDAALTLFTSRVKDAKGRTVQVQMGQERNGRVTARIVYDVPLAAATGLVEKFKASGQVRVQRVEQNARAPEGKLAVTRLDVTLSNGELLVPQEEGLGKNVRGGLAFSLRALSVSAGWLIVALLFVLPWVVLVWVAVWLVRRLWGRGHTSAPPAASAAGTGT